MRVRSNRSLLSLLLVAWLLVQAAHAGSLVSVAPAGASAGVTLNVTGSGFDATPANNQVTFTPPSGPAIIVTGTAISAPDAAGLRRLTVRVPEGLPVGAAALRVTNRITGEVSAGQSVEILTLSLPETNSGSPGAAGLRV